MSDQFVWDLLPWEFLYGMYKQWCKDNTPSGKMTSKRGFTDQMREIAETDATWGCPCAVDKDGRKKDKQISSTGRIAYDEPLGRAVGYDFGDMVRWRGVYRGLLRRIPTPRPQVQPQKGQATTNHNPQDGGQTITYAEACGLPPHNPAR